MKKMIALWSCVLVACAGPAPSEGPSKWSYSEVRDEMRNKVTEKAARLSAEGVDGYVKQLIVTKSASRELKIHLHPQDTHPLPQSCLPNDSVNIKVDNGEVKSIKCSDDAIALSLDPALILDLLSAKTIWIESGQPVIGVEQSKFLTTGLKMESIDFD